MILFELVAERAREIREFILLPWPEKKKRARQFWEKYGRLYILLFILATAVAVINVYMETHDTARSQIGGDDTKPLTQNTSSNNTTSKEPGTEPTKDNKPSTTTTPETAAAANTSKKNNDGSTEKTDSKTETSKNTINITTQVSTTLPATNSSKSSKDRISEIKARRKEKQQQRAKQSSVQESISSLGNNLTAGISGGTGRALSVLGTFFSAILGLLLFCCAPVVIFYMWMKKLIMPLFPAPNINSN